MHTTVWHTSTVHGHTERAVVSSRHDAGSSASRLPGLAHVQLPAGIVATTGARFTIGRPPCSSDQRGSRKSQHDPTRDARVDDPNQITNWRNP